MSSNTITSGNANFQSPVVDVIILAGGDGSVIDPRAPAKGLVLVAGKPMVQWVLEALRQSKYVRNIAVVLPPDLDTDSWKDLADHVVFSDGMVSDNIMAAWRALGADGMVMSITSDIPSVIPAAIDEFVELTVQSGAQLSYPFISEADTLREYPGAQRTFINLKDGKFTGGNAMILYSEHFEHLRDVGQEIFEARKNPIRMANMVGTRFALRLVAGRLTLNDLQQRVGEIIQMKCAALVVKNASIGADVDKPADIAAVVAKLREMGKIDE